MAGRSRPVASLSFLSYRSPPNKGSYGERNAEWPLKKGARQAYLRLEVRHGFRHGSEVRWLISADGENWMNLDAPRSRTYTFIPKKL